MYETIGYKGKKYHLHHMDEDGLTELKKNLLLEHTLLVIHLSEGLISQQLHDMVSKRIHEVVDKINGLIEDARRDAQTLNFLGKLTNRTEY